MALTLGTFLQQGIRFSFTDLSVLLDKVRTGDVRSVSGYGNNVVDPLLDRTVQPGDPGYDPALANGSAFNEFIRISGVNNYPGAGNLTPQQIADAALAAGITLDPQTGGVVDPQTGLPTGLLPNERLISDVLSNQGTVDMPQGGAWNNLFMDIGQYVDHGLDFFNKGANGSYVINDGTLTPNPNGTISATRANGGTTGTYNNTLSNWINQSQTYGSEAAVTFLLTESVRDAQGNLVRDAQGNLLKTAKLLGGSGFMAANRIGNDPNGRAVDFPSGYDILINNGVDQALLDSYITANLANSQLVQQWVNDVTVYLQYTQDPAAWALANPGAPAPANPNPTGSPMTMPANVAAAVGALQGGWAAIQADPYYVDLNAVVPGTVNQTLIGDMGFGAGFDPVYLMQHYVGGDLRANENVLLTSIHSLFHNSHNALVDGIYASLAELQAQITSSGVTSLDQIDPGLRPFFSQDPATGAISLNVLESEVFDMARSTVNGMYQRMVFDQYLTALVGGVPFGNPVAQDFINQPAFFGQLPVGIQEHGLNGFYPEVNAAISVEFNTAGFRVGHTQIYENIDYLQLTNGQLSYADLAASANTVANVVGVNGVPLIEAFLRPEMVGALGGPGAILAGNAQAPAQQVDTYLHDVVRNLLVGRPNDLGAFNTMRGREIGLPTMQQFLNATTTLLQATGVASTLGTAASDTQAGLGQFVIDPNTGLPVLSPNGLATQIDILAERLRPYTSWRDFGTTMRGVNLDAVTGDLIAGSLLDGFMRLYATELFDGTPDAAGLATGNLLAGALDGAVGLDRVDLWIGMLAEAPVLTPNGPGAVPSMLGRTGTYIISEQFDRLQDGDLHYYKQDLMGADVFNQIAFQTFTAQITAAFKNELAAQFIHQDTFRRFQLDNLATNTTAYTVPTTAVIALEELLATPGATLVGANPLLDPAALDVLLNALLNADGGVPLLNLIGTLALADLPAAAAVLLAELALENPAAVAALEAQLLAAIDTAPVDANGDPDLAAAAQALVAQAVVDGAAVEAFIAGGGDVVTFAGLDPALLPTAQLAVIGLRFDNHLIIGNDRDNVIVGSSGWDDIRAGGGNDTVDAGDGIDFVYGQGGNDFLYAGNDIVLDNLYGGDGNDVLLGAINSEDILFGEDGNDLLILNTGLVGGIGQGGAGADVILGGANANVIRGDSGIGDGDDTLVGGAGGDDIVGGGGNDLIMGGQHDAPGNVLGADVGAIVLPAPDRLYGDHESSHNAEILARVLEQDVTGTWFVNQAKLLSLFGANPLRLDIGTAAQISAINPLTGELFTAEQRAAIDTFITGTRVVPQTTDPTAPGYIDLAAYQNTDPTAANYLNPALGPIDLNHPGLAGLQVRMRGPQVLTNWVGYVPAGNDTIYTSTTNAVFLEAVAQARGIAAGVNGTVQFLDANGVLQTVNADNAVLNWAAEQLPATPVPARLDVELAFGLDQAIFGGPIFDAAGNVVAGPLFDVNGNPIAGFTSTVNGQGFVQIDQPLFAADPTAVAIGDILFDAAGGQFEVVNTNPANFQVAQLDANGVQTGAVFGPLNIPPLTVNDPLDLAPGEALIPFVAPTPVTVQLRRPLADQVFAGAGDDTVITDAHNDTLLFGGLGTDTLDYSSMAGVDLTLDINSQASQPQGTDGVAIHANSALDRFYSFEKVQFSELSTDFNTVTLTTGAAQVDADLIAAARNGVPTPNSGNAVDLAVTGGVATVLNGVPAGASGIAISGAEQFVLSSALTDRVTFLEMAPSAYSVTFNITADPATETSTRLSNGNIVTTNASLLGLVAVTDATGKTTEFLNTEQFVFDLSGLFTPQTGMAAGSVNISLDAGYTAFTDTTARLLTIALGTDTANSLGLLNKSFQFDAAFDVFVNGTQVLESSPKDNGDAVFTVTGVVAGTAAVGTALSISETTPDPDGSGVVTHTWEASTNGTTWTAVATGASFTVPNGVQGQQLRVTSTYTDGEGFSEAVTNAVGAVPFVNDGQATFVVTGSPVAGSTLTVTESVPDPDGGNGAGGVTYTWQTSADNTNWTVAGTGSSYTLAAGATGYVRAIADYTDGEGFTESVTLASNPLANEGSPLSNAVLSTFAEYGTLNPISNLGAGALSTSDWTTVLFSRTFVNPVVIISDPTYNGAQPLVVRMQNLSGNGFQYALQEYNYLDGAHAPETLSYLVMEAGTHVLADGSSFTAGTVNTNLLSSAGFAALPVAAAGTTTLLTQVQTFNGPDAVVTRTRVDGLTGNYQVAMQEQQSLNGGAHMTETIGYVAFTAANPNGTASEGDLLIEGGLSQGIGHAGGTVNFDQNFTNAPTLLTKVSTFTGADTANSRITGVTADGFSAFVQEEQSFDAEMLHAPEQIGFLAFEGPAGTLAGTSALNPLTANQPLNGIDPLINNPVI